MKKILVIGSLNMDTVIETPYIPQSGETLAGKSIALVPGGKGANQAYTKDLAVSMGKTVIIDPAPALPGLPDSFWQGVDYIKPNETELEILTGRPLNCQADLEAAAGEMFSKGVRNVMVSLGGDGCLLMNREGMHFYPAKKVHAVDTTAAGDCFMGAFALALSRGADVAEAITYGQKASAIAVTRKGAQSSIPNPEEIQS